MIKTLYFKLLRIIRSLKWKLASMHLRKNLSQKSNTELKILPDSKILILAPHADDEWIGCYSLLKKYNCTICSMDMDGGNDITTKNIRFQEMMTAASLLNAQLIRIRDEKMDILHKTIYKIKPQIIAVPFFMDWHDEHIETMTILRDAITNYECDILMYQVSCPIPFEAVNCTFSISKSDWKEKWSLFRDIYKTQKGFPWQRFAAIERAEGKYTDSYAANVFSIMDSTLWQQSFGMQFSNEQKEYVRKNINNVYKFFTYINLVYGSKLDVKTIKR